MLALLTVVQFRQRSAGLAGVCSAWCYLGQFRGWDLHRAVRELMRTVGSPLPGPPTFLCQIRAPKAHIPREKELSRVASPFMTSSSWGSPNFHLGSKEGSAAITPQWRSIRKNRWQQSMSIIAICGKYSFPNVSFLLSAMFYVLDTIH